MRFLIGFFVGVCAGFVVAAALTGEDKRLARLAGEPAAAALP